MPISKTFATLFLYTSAFVIRIIILNSHSLSKTLGNRVEIATPLTSWKKAVEGVSLWKHAINPYDGDNFHESPLALLIYSYILNCAQEWISVIFGACDLLTALVLSWAAKLYLKDVCQKEGETSKFPSSASVLLLKQEYVKWVPFYVAAMYLLCPYSVLACGGKSTAVFSNFYLSLFILFTISGQWLMSPILLALCTYNSFYYITLLVPLTMYIHQKSNYHKNKMIIILRLMSTAILFLSSSVLLLFYSHKVTSSWNFLLSTYGFTLSFPDLTPNIGLFWYFFTEMFEHFRIFFLCTFQLNVFVYTAPLAIRLRKEPIFLLFVQLMIISIFKSYPSIGDVAFYFSLLPIWSHFFHFMKQRFIICCILASCTLLAPTVWYLWIYSGSANANFYFGITLAFNTGQVFLLTDILSAYIKREYYLENGVQYKEDGSLVLMRLQ
ncbi:phosphatidylinositol glycan anchor biosynthesis class U protein-like [Uloborus diversus]|uniref:phosphatidylinositol glycan anchor biosynthesis class U protein-like n=1 Tax=Uloborus diversus TaxID=327109 RepID=UPI00240A4A0F|nr:phosphatidylinositol glycan anchor biosynthesis class U protein-like [Uloborus diversus]